MADEMYSLIDVEQGQGQGQGQGHYNRAAEKAISAYEKKLFGNFMKKPQCNVANDAAQDFA